MYVWGEARARSAQVVLRIEDHDRQRCRPEYERALLDDLDWLGFVPDLDSTDTFRSGPSPLRQRDNGDVYQRFTEVLVERGYRVYACDCSRKGLSTETGDVPDRESPYPGRCRHRALQPGPGRGLRLVLDDNEERFDDLRMGWQTQIPARQCGDLLLRDRSGNWTYQFAVVVDDLRHEIDLVIRGADLLESTGRQILLARMLGRRDPPWFLHHPLLRRADGAKLSKASGDTSIEELRRSGLSPGALFGRVLCALGVRPHDRPIPLADALEVVTRA